MLTHGSPYPRGASSCWLTGQLRLAGRDVGESGWTVGKSADRRFAASWLAVCSRFCQPSRWATIAASSKSHRPILMLPETDRDNGVRQGG